MVCSVIEHSSRPIINARGIPQLWQNFDWMTSYSFKNFKIPTPKMCIRTMTIFLLLLISATKLTLLESRTACFERNLIFVKMFEVWSQCLNNNWRDYVSLVPRVFSFSNMAAAGGKTPGTQQSHVNFGIPQRTHTLRTLQKPPSLFWKCKPIRAHVWNAPISDRFMLLCSRVFSPVAAILENEKIPGTRSRLCHPGRVRELVENYTT